MNDERLYEAEVWRIAGELLLRIGETESGRNGDKVFLADSPFHRFPVSSPEEAFLKAIAIAQKQQAKSLELRAVMSLARLWQLLGKRPEDHQMLAEIYHWFTEGFDTKDLQEAKALLAEAGYPNGFEMLFIAPESQKIEAQVMKTMYERIGLKVKLEVMSHIEWLGKVWAPTDKEAEAQDWDISVCHNIDSFGHTGAAHLTWPYLDASEVRWIEYDPTYERMWKDMAATLDEAAQDEKMRQLEQYVYDRAYAIFIYSPLDLYAVNKAVNFVPQKG